MDLYARRNARHYRRFTATSVCHLCVYVTSLSSSFKTLNTDGSFVSGTVPCQILRHLISNLIEFIPLCIQKIFKIMLNKLTQLWFYLKTTCFGLNVDHNQAKNISRRAACCMSTCHLMTIFFCLMTVRIQTETCSLATHTVVSDWLFNVVLNRLLRWYRKGSWTSPPFSTLFSFFSFSFC